MWLFSIWIFLSYGKKKMWHGRSERIQCVLKERVTLKCDFVSCSLCSSSWFRTCWSIRSFWWLRWSHFSMCWDASWSGNEEAHVAASVYRQNCRAPNLSFLNSVISNLPFYLFMKISSGSLALSFLGGWTQLSFPGTACFYILGNIFWVMQMLWQCIPFVIRALTHSLD